MIRVVILIIFIAQFLFSCSSISYLPKPKDYPLYINGMYFEGVEEKERKLIKFAGEIISVEKDSIISLVVSGKEPRKIFTVRKNKIRKGKVRIAKTSDDPEKFLLFGINILLPFTHGLYGAFTIPTMIPTTIGTISGAYRASFYIEYPKDIQWNEISKFARFPQGLPENVQLHQLEWSVKP